MKPKIERYSPERKAEFLLSNSVDTADYRRARNAARRLGLDPDRILHIRPPASRPRATHRHSLDT